MMSFTDNIPAHMFNVWSELFKKSGGVFDYNPILAPATKYRSSYVHVSCSFKKDSDYTKFRDAYDKFPTKVVETKRSTGRGIKMRLTYYINKLIGK
jgi:hypothetical protein